MLNAKQKNSVIKILGASALNCSQLRSDMEHSPESVLRDEILDSIQDLRKAIRKLADLIPANSPVGEWSEAECRRWMELYNQL